MTWQEHEDEIERLLIENNIVYRREGVLHAYGHETGKGESDFKILNCDIGIIEAKCVNKLTRVNYPRPRIKESLIKPHQLKACRESNGGVLIYDNETENYYWLTPNKLDNIIIEHGLVASLKGYIDDCVVDVGRFIQRLKRKTNKEI